MASEAVLTVITVQRGLQNCRVADRPSDDTFPDLRHNTGRFMSENHGVYAGRIADAAFGEVVDIGAADSDGGYADLDVTGVGVGRRGGVDETEGVFLTEFGESHGERTGLETCSTTS